MIDFTVSTTIQKPVGEVFDFISYNQHGPEWVGGLIETRHLSDSRGLGARWTDVIQVLGQRLETDFEVTEYEPNQQVRFKSFGGPMPIEGAYTFSVDASGTTVTFRLKGETKGFFKLAEPLVARTIERQWATNLANLKDLLEASES